MAILALDPSGDISLAAGGAFVQRDPSIETAARLQQRHKFFLGTWFLDTTLGIPYFQLVFKMNPDLGIVAQMFRSVILSTPGVASLTSLDLDHRTTTRELLYSFACVDDHGATIVGGSGEPFRVAVPTSGGIQ